METLAQGHTARKWQSWDSDPGSQTRGPRSWRLLCSPVWPFLGRTLSDSDGRCGECCLGPDAPGLLPAQRRWQSRGLCELQWPCLTRGWAGSPCPACLSRSGFEAPPGWRRWLRCIDCKVPCGCDSCLCELAFPQARPPWIGVGFRVGPTEVGTFDSGLEVV